MYVAVQSPSYPRNQRIRDYLERTFAAEINILSLSPKPGYLRHSFELLRAGAQASRAGVDVVILAELSLVFFPVSWILARHNRALYIVDFFVGLHETHVVDRKLVAKWSLKSFTYRAIDLMAAKSADLLLADTDIRAARWRAWGTQTITLPVGAPHWARALAPREQDGVLRVLYYGNYIALHGIEKVMPALVALSHKANLRLTMVGTGEKRAEVERFVRSSALADRTRFINFLPSHELRDEIAVHDLILGIFGDSDKATSVIANKVWQGLASGRVVVTRHSPVLSEIRQLVPYLLVESRDGEPDSIGAALDAARMLTDRPSGNPDVDLESYVGSRFEHLRLILLSEGFADCETKGKPE